MALAVGVAMAATVALVGLVRAPEVAGIVAISMLVIVLVGSLVGMSLPFVFARFGLDPATASAPWSRRWLTSSGYWSISAPRPGSSG